MKPFEASVNLTLKVRDFNRYDGVSQKTGNPYTMYFMEVEDPISNEQYSFTMFATDGKKPPEVGMEYPLVVEIRKNRFELQYTLKFPENMVS